MTGFSDDEIDDAQLRNGITFPPDLVELLRTQKFLTWQDGRQFEFTCMSTDKHLLQRVRRHPYQTLRFDLEHNNLWWPSWGQPPRTLEAKRRKLREVLRLAPPLISLRGHRYLPAIPLRAGNPVLSMMGIDTIYYGNDVWDWMRADKFIPSREGEVREVRVIQFWSELVGRYEAFNMNQAF